MISGTKKLSIRLEAVGGNKVRQEFKKLGTDGEQAFIRITNVINPANDRLRAINETAKAFNGVLKQAAGFVGAYLGFQGLTNTFKSIVGVNMEFERLSGSLKTVTGSAKAADEAFKLIEEFATSTPYQLDEIVDSFIRLKAMGLEPSMEALTSYGNSASAFGRNILDFVEAVAAATVGEFERLKSFGIKARVEAETVNFTFQGITTQVSKNASDIENYLRSIGDVNFAGAMTEQMNTMGGVMSNIEDSMAKIARTIGSHGLNAAIKDVLSEFDTLISSTDTAAKSIGETLATAVRLAGDAFFFLAENIEPIVALLTVRLSASTITKTWVLLRGAVLAFNTTLIGAGAATSGAILGMNMMWQVSKLTAAGMYAATVATNAFRVALAFLGGPAGAVLLVAYALYKLVDSQNVAKRAAQDHAETLQRLKDQMRETSAQNTVLTTSVSNDRALAEWGHRLKTAQTNIKELNKELKETGGLPFLTRNTPNIFLDRYKAVVKGYAEMLSESKISLEEYEKLVWKTATVYPDFKPMADEIQEKILTLKAAKEDAETAQKELEYIKHPEKRPKEEKPAKEIIPAEIKVKTVKMSSYEKTMEDLKNKLFELQSPYEQAVQKAEEWRDNTLASIARTSSAYEGFSDDVNRVYEDMMQKAKQIALEESTYWKDGLIRGMQSTYEDMGDLAKHTEDLVKNSFIQMSDTLTDFVVTGKASFSDFVNSIVEDMVRMSIQYAIVSPIMSGLLGYLGFPIAHGGGVIGTDNLTSRHISADVFSNAPRYHTGGLVGNEIPIIAQRGETVFTRGQMDALGTELNSKSPVYVNVNVHNNASGTTASATANRDSNGNMSIDVMVEQIEGAIGKNISKGEGLSPILEQRYALNPAFGSYR